MTLEIRDDVARRLLEKAEAEGATPDDLIQAWLSPRNARRERLRALARELEEEVGPLPPFRNEWFTAEARYGDE